MTPEQNCMSMVIGNWVIIIQDAMPAEMRNSAEWKALLPELAGTGRDPDLERKRLDLIKAHMWDVALPLVQPVADAHGFGREWRKMITEKSSAAAQAAAAVGNAAEAAAEWAVAANVAWATTMAAKSAAAESASKERAAIWQAIDPVGLLEKLIDITAESK